MIYDTDTAHCEGNECKKKETCLRYALHQMREKMRGIDGVLIPYFLNESNKECSIYIKK